MATVRENRKKLKTLLSAPEIVAAPGCGDAVTARLVELAGLPAISLPAGLDADGLPLGLHLIAKPFAEATLFRAARALEEACAFDARPPGFGGGK